LGSQPRQRACKVAGQKGNLGVTPHALDNVGKSEGMNLQTPKTTQGKWNFGGFPNF